MKIVIIGGGSLEWTPKIIKDMALTAEIKGSTIVLQDIDEEAANLQQELAQLICQEAGVQLEVEATTDREHALAGADFVVFQISVGGLEAHRVDLEVPARYGMMQPVGANVGPGGINRALRHIPVTIDLCRAMERLCPRAWLINLTNPMTQICWAATQETSIRTIGLCHEIDHFRHHLVEELFDVAAEDIWVQVGGINHLPWISEMRVRGEDGLALLREWLAKHGPNYFARLGVENTPESVFRDRHAAKFEVFLSTGLLPGAGDRHVVEFFPHFVRPETNSGLDYGVELTTIEHRYERKTSQEAQVKRWLAGEERLKLDRSPEQTSRIIAALSGGPADRFVVNIPNEGQISNLRRDAVVECMAVIDQFGVHPEFFGELATSARAVTAWHLEEMALTLDAAISGDRTKALQAVRMDPVVTNWETAETVLEEMIAGTAAYLPQFIQ
jgi:alpha-galactosidase